MNESDPYLRGGSSGRHCLSKVWLRKHLHPGKRLGQVALIIKYEKAAQQADPT